VGARGMAIDDGSCGAPRAGATITGDADLISLTRVMGTKTDHVYVAVRNTVFMMPHKVASSSIKAALRRAIGCTRPDRTGLSRRNDFCRVCRTGLQDTGRDGGW